MRYPLIMPLLAVLVLLGVTPARALDVAGVKFDDSAKVGRDELVVNGGGLRKMAFFKIYAMALYLPEKQSDAEGVLGAKGGKRIAISLLRDLSAQQFVDALQEGLAENHSAAELDLLKDRVRQFSETMLAVSQAKSGAMILIDWIPESGTRLTVNAETKGRDIAGEDFYRALLKIWLGSQPVEADLKQALLGKES